MSLALNSSDCRATDNARSNARPDYHVRLVWTLPVGRALVDLIREFAPGFAKPPLATVIVPDMPGLSISMMRAPKGGEKSMHVVGRYPGDEVMPYAQWRAAIGAFVLRLRVERPDLFQKYPAYAEDIR